MTCKRLHEETQMFNKPNVFQKAWNVIMYVVKFRRTQNDMDRWVSERLVPEDYEPESWDGLDDEFECV